MSVKEALVKPVFRRIGTYVAGFVSAYLPVTSELETQIVAGSVVLGGVLFDVFLSNADRSRRGSVEPR